MFHSKRKNFKNIQDEISRLVIEKRITPVIILDEANCIPSETLNDLKMLLNFEMDSRDNIILLLIGQSVIASTLERKSHEALRQRISMNYNLDRLTRNQTIEYMDMKPEKTGVSTTLLTPAAYNLIANASNSIPRVVNQIMDKALLLLATTKDVDQINEEMMDSAINENTI